MFLVTLIIVGLLYIVSGGGCPERKNGTNYKLMLASIICSILTLVTVGKREEMTIMFIIVSIGLWIAFAYDKHLKKNLAHGEQYIEHVSGTNVSMPLHSYGTEDNNMWLNKEDAKLSSSQICSTNTQIIKKYYILGSNIYIYDGGVEKNIDK